jgi:DUF4097 and DUF4098 domain-containing protein YvlB
MVMRGRTLTTFLALLAGASSLTSSLAHAQRRGEDNDEWMERCREQRYSDRPQFCEVRELGLRPTGRLLTVDGRQNGGVIVRGWDRDSIHVQVRIQAQGPSDEDARDLARAVRIESTGGNLHAEGPENIRRSSWSATFYVDVPRRTDLTLETVNGPIMVERVSGTIEMHAVNGPIEIFDLSGDVRGRTANGPLGVELTGTRWDGRGLDVETSNGPIDLAIPEGYAARIETGTVNGPFSVDFPFTIQGRFTGKRISQEIGGGGPPVRVVTTNGPATISRRR